MVKINNYYVGKKYSDIVKTNTPNIETHQLVSPVMIVNPSDAAAETQQSFPKPNTRQTLKCKIINVSTSATSYQVATKTATTRIYLLSMYYVNQTTTATLGYVWDNITDGATSLTANSMYEMGVDDTYILFGTPGTSGDIKTLEPTLPQEFKQGIRVRFGGASQGGVLVVWYIEEDISFKL